MTVVYSSMKHRERWNVLYWCWHANSSLFAADEAHTKPTGSNSARHRTMLKCLFMASATAVLLSICASQLDLQILPRMNSVLPGGKPPDSTTLPQSPDSRGYSSQRSVKVSAPGFIPNPSQSQGNSSQSDQASDPVIFEYSKPSWERKTTSPYSKEWNNSIALCIAVKDEHYQDFREWVTYYKWLGVDHIYMYENSSKYPIDIYLQDFIDEGFLTYKQRNIPNQQVVIFKLCDMYRRESHNWMMYLDADEFLEVREKDKTLKEVLDDYKFEAGLSVHWLMHGSSDQVSRPEGGGMMRTYDKCHGVPSSIVKTIVNNHYVENVQNPHNQRYQNGMQAINTDGTKLEPVTKELSKVTLTPMSVRDGKKSFKKLALHHYMLRSHEDYIAKLERSVARARQVKTWETFHKVNALQKSLPICEGLIPLAEKCCSREREAEIALKYDFAGLWAEQHRQNQSLEEPIESESDIGTSAEIEANDEIEQREDSAASTTTYSRRQMKL